MRGISHRLLKTLVLIVLSSRGWGLLSVFLWFPPGDGWAATSGQVVSWGQIVLPYVEPGTRYIAIAARAEHNLALKLDGTVVAWGDNSIGQSTVLANLSGVTAITAGAYHSLALKSDGTVVAWGDNSRGQSTVLANLSGVLAIAAGFSHSLAIVGVVQVPTVAVSGVRADARTQPIPVHYQIALSHAAVTQIGVEVSINGGASYVPVISGALSGEVGAGIAAGSRTLYWNAALSLPPGTFSANCKIRITATAGGASSIAVSPAFAVEVPGAGTLVTVRGRALNASTGLPLAGATVTFGGQTVISAADGHLCIQ